MATVRKRRISNSEYFYLVHSIKAGKKVVKKELYLGKKVPTDIEQIKREFLNEIYKEKWLKKLDLIKANFRDERREMPPTAWAKYLEHFMIKFTYNTNRIEGGTLSLRETSILLEEGITPPNKPLKDIKEAEAHKKVFYEMLNCRKGLGLQLILYWHKLLFQETAPDIAGKIRLHQVGIAGTKVELPSPVELYPLLREFFSWYSREKNKLHPVELAALAHLKFVSIHPFADGNGRISRLMMNFILNKHGFPMLNIDYANRSSYYTALERAQIKKIDYLFVQYLLKRYLKEYGKYQKQK